MAPKRFLSKSRRTFRPTGTKVAKKKAASKFGFKKFFKSYPSAQMALSNANRETNYRTRYPSYFRPGAPYGQVRSALQRQAVPRIVDLATSTKARLISSTFKSMSFEEELSYTRTERAIENSTVAVRYLWQLKVSISDLISNVLSKHLDRFKELKDIHYITFDRISVKVRLYNHPISGAKPYHGYNWDPATAMDTETVPFPINLEFGKSYNGKGFMSLKFNITGFVVKNGGSPYIKLVPSIDLASLKQTLRLAPTLHLYAHYPTESSPPLHTPELGRTVTKIYYRLHQNDMKKENTDVQGSAFQGRISNENLLDQINRLASRR